ncbi:unnamed protein product [Ectocarpus fasciculatus]
MEATSGTSLRGMFDKDDDSVHPLVNNSIFKACPAGMRFETKEDCKRFVREHCQEGSNPDYPWMQQIFTTLVTWSQLEQYLFPRLRDIWKKTPFRKAAPLDPDRNVFLGEAEPSGDWPLHAEVLAGVRKRLDLPFHGGGVDASGRQQGFLSCASTENTLRYLFHHMRCGILVVIRNKRLVVFAPFANKDYTNDWDGALGVKEETLQDYYRKKEESYRKENVIQGVDKWWANGNIICNEHQRPRETHSQYWGDHFNSPLRDMIEQACSSRDVADCEFFINKRDYPQLKFNPNSLKPVEPYGFIYDKDDRDPEQDVPLKRHRYPSFTPIVSFYCSERFADIPFPTSEDWEAATGMVFPKTFSHQVNKEGEVEIDEPRDLFTQENFKKFECDWADKQETAFFRGTATGGGTTRETNQRLAISWQSFEWESSPKHNGKGSSSSSSDGGGGGGSTDPLLDAAIVGWNLRDKKIAGQEMRFLDPTTIPFKGGRENFTPIYQQSKFKYLVYVEGHCAACRYGFMMRLGSVILKVTSRCVADSMWYFPLLQPWVDHVPIKADLSDLEEKIRWCRSHDDECRKMAASAAKLYEKFVSRDAALDYVEMLSHEINSRYRIPPTWWTPSAALVDIPPPKAQEFACNVCSREGKCTRCKADENDEQERKKKLEKKKEDTAEDKKRQEKRARESILKRAKAKKKKQQEEEDQQQQQRQQQLEAEKASSSEW